MIDFSQANLANRAALLPGPSPNKSVPRFWVPYETYFQRETLLDLEGLLPTGMICMARNYFESAKIALVQQKPSGLENTV